MKDERISKEHFDNMVESWRIQVEKLREHPKKNPIFKQPPIFDPERMKEDRRHNGSPMRFNCWRMDRKDENEKLPKR